MRQYIGARYMPKFMGTYDATTAYEALSVVDNGMGTSYVSNKPTPAGTPLTDTNYWAVYGSVSGAVLDLQDQIDDINTGLGKIIKDDVTLSGKLELSDNNYTLNNSSITGGNGDYVELTDGNLKNVDFSTDNPLALDVKGSARVQDNDIVNVQSQGVTMNQAAVDEVIISGNNVESLNYGVLLNEDAIGGNVLIDGNIIKSDEGDAVEINNPNGLHKNAVVSANILSAGAVGGSGSANGFSVGLAKAKNTSVVGNVSGHSRIAGAHVENNVDGVVLSSNVFDECYKDGAWIYQGYGDVMGSSGLPIVHSGNIYKGNATDKGINVIYAADRDDSVICDQGNIYSNFNTGISSSGNVVYHQHFRLFNDMVENCDTGIITRPDVHGKIIIDNCSKGIVIDEQNDPVIIDDINFLHAPDADDIIKFNYSNSSAIFKHLFMQKTVANGTNYQLMPAPTYAKGRLIVRAQHSYAPFKIYEIDGTTLTEIYSKPYGTITIGLAISGGYLEAQTNTTFIGILTLDFEGHYVINN